MWCNWATCAWVRGLVAQDPAPSLGPHPILMAALSATAPIHSLVLWRQQAREEACPRSPNISHPLHHLCGRPVMAKKEEAEEEPPAAEVSAGVHSGGTLCLHSGSGVYCGHQTSMSPLPKYQPSCVQCIRAYVGLGECLHGHQVATPQCHCLLHSCKGKAAATSRPLWNYTVEVQKEVESQKRDTVICYWSEEGVCQRQQWEGPSWVVGVEGGASVAELPCLLSSLYTP